MSEPLQSDRVRPRGPAWVPTLLSFLLLTVFIAVPVVCVFWVAFAKGVSFFAAAVSSEETLSAVRLSCLIALCAVPLNTLFGLCAAWALTRFQFRGKGLLLALIDLPLAVSPVVAGLLLILVFGSRGLLGPWLAQKGLHVVYAFPGMVIATTFVTFPFVARELVPVMESLGSEEEVAAASLGASGGKIFWRVTLPNIRWGLLSGVVLCTARALGEFGAVSVVSGHIRGETNTLPLHVEILYNDYNQVGAFAVASLLSLVGLLTLALRGWLERRAAFGTRP